LLTVPHGGRDSVRNVPLRSRGKTSSDAHTIEFIEAVAKHLERDLGAQPYVVAARFSRKHIDANRAEGEAFDSPAAKPAYDAYHDRIRVFVSRIKARFPQGALLLDIHGQSDDRNVVHRGTQNGETAQQLRLSSGTTVGMLSSARTAFSVWFIRRGTRYFRQILRPGIRGRIDGSTAGIPYKHMAPAQRAA
jgi:N-formylglutamate amidohydrolase